MKKTPLQNDLFITIKPLSEKISRYISYYYFHQSDDQNYQKNFIFYPNYKHALTAYKDAEVVISDNKSVIKPAAVTCVQQFYSINKDKSIKVSIKGKFNKIGIVFNPLGINYFIQKPLCEVITSDIIRFQYFGEKFDTVLNLVFLENSTERKAALLDAFFEESLFSFDETMLKKAIGEIIISNGGTKVSELSDKLKINRKTLLRLFHKHTAMSVEEYRKMVMFRQAFNYFQQHKENTRLTDVALFSLYYDQAHFIKHFKSITKETPNTLLSKISHLGQEDTYWYFED